MTDDWIKSDYALIDLSPYQGQTISLVFEFEASDDFFSTVFFSNINIEPVPELTTFFLLGTVEWDW